MKQDINKNFNESLNESLHQDGNNPIDDLAQHVEQLKLKIPHTRQLYQQLAFDLFTKFEQTPTPKRLYELAKKGSMSTVVEELKIFWQNLQQNFQQKIERPDIPDALISSYRQSMEDIWQQAMAHATQNFSQERQEMQQKLEDLSRQSQQQLTELTIQKENYLDLENHIKQKTSEFDDQQSIWLAKNQTAEQNILKLQDDLQQQKLTQQEEQTKQQQKLQDILLKQQQREEQMQNKLEQLQTQHKEELHHWQKMFDKERTHAKQEATRFENALNAAQEKRLQLYQDYQKLMQEQQALQKKLERSEALLLKQAKEVNQSNQLNQTNQANINLPTHLNVKKFKTTPTSAVNLNSALVKKKKLK